MSSLSLYALQLDQNASQGKWSEAPAPHIDQAKLVPLGAGSLPVHIPSRAGYYGACSPTPRLPYGS